ncbi:MAG: hypothetical protein MHM6MM_005100 [Cercozoa sp. M6MM]
MATLAVPSEDKSALLSTPIAEKTLTAYFFNITNLVDVVTEGQPPQPEKIGPFTWKVFESRRDVAFSPDESEVSFHMSRRAVFDPVNSCKNCKETDTVNTVYLTFLELLMKIGGESQLPFVFAGPVLEMLVAELSQKSELASEQDIATQWAQGGILPQSLGLEYHLWLKEHEGSAQVVHLTPERAAEIIFADRPGAAFARQDEERGFWIASEFLRDERSMGLHLASQRFDLTDEEGLSIKQYLKWVVARQMRPMLENAGVLLSQQPPHIFLQKPVKSLLFGDEKLDALAALLERTDAEDDDQGGVQQPLPFFPLSDETLDQFRLTVSTGADSKQVGGKLLRVNGVNELPSRDQDPFSAMHFACHTRVPIRGSVNGVFGDTRGSGAFASWSDAVKVTDTVDMFSPLLMRPIRLRQHRSTTLGDGVHARLLVPAVSQFRESDMNDFVRDNVLDSRCRSKTPLLLTPTKYTGTGNWKVIASDSKLKSKSPDDNDFFADPDEVSSRRAEVLVDAASGVALRTTEWAQGNVLVPAWLTATQESEAKDMKHEFLTPLFAVKMEQKLSPKQREAVAALNSAIRRQTRLVWFGIALMAAALVLFGMLFLRMRTESLSGGGRKSVSAAKQRFSQVETDSQAPLQEAAFRIQEVATVDDTQDDQTVEQVELA